MLFDFIAANMFLRCYEYQSASMVGSVLCDRIVIMYFKETLSMSVFALAMALR